MPKKPIRRYSKRYLRYPQNIPWGIFGWSLWMLSSCQSAPNEREYLAFLQDVTNGCRLVQHEANIQVDIQYWPPEAEPLRLRKPAAEIPQGMRYFQVKMTPWKTNTLPLNPHYWAFGMQHDFWLETPRGKLPCVFFHAEQGTHPQEGHTCFVGFEVPKDWTEAGTLLLISAQLGIGPLRFTPHCQPPAIRSTP